MSRDGPDGEGLELLAVEADAVAAVDEAGGPAAPTGPTTRTADPRATNSDEVDELERLIGEFFSSALGARVDEKKTTEAMSAYCSTSRKVTGWNKALRGAEDGVTDFAWCRALVLVALHDASLAALQAEDTKSYALDGWPSRALLLELLRMFDGCLGLGDSAAKLVDYQSSDRKVEDIKKDGAGKIKSDFGRSIQNLLRRASTGRHLPTFAESVQAVDCFSAEFALQNSALLQKIRPPEEPHVPQLAKLLQTFELSKRGRTTTLDVDEVTVLGHLRNWLKDPEQGLEAKHSLRLIERWGKVGTVVPKPVEFAPRSTSKKKAAVKAEKTAAQKAAQKNEVKYEAVGAKFKLGLAQVAAGAKLLQASAKPVLLQKLAEAELRITALEDENATLRKQVEEPLTQIQEAAKKATSMREGEAAQLKGIAEKVEKEATAKRARLEEDLKEMKTKRTKLDEAESLQKRAKLDEEAEALKARETKVAIDEGMLKRLLGAVERR